MVMIIYTNINIYIRKEQLNTGYEYIIRKRGITLHNTKTCHDKSENFFQYCDRKAY